ncbi:vacuolar fusion protein ccz1 [Mortierella sp. NVP85]|nr:vacuolar fusion protein ccz1 [Mortierella sp. NVP85]
MYGSSNTTSPKTATTASPSSSSGPSTTPPTLGYFCIYNPDFGPTDETQHEQLLYYVARKTVSMDVKMRNIGLAQGLVNFARIFSPTAPCENVHSQKNRLVFYEAEPGYWLHLCIELGTIRRSVKGADGNNRVITEYLENELHDTVISALLKQAYGMYRVVNGTMESLVNAHDGNTRPLQRRLEEFFESWVLGWDFEKTMTLERALDGINYLPMSKTGTMATDRLVKSVRDKYQGMITHSMVTFEDLLVSSDIRDEDLRPVWKHVVQLTGYDGASASAAWSRKEEEEARKRKNSTFKFIKSWSNTAIFGFYRPSSSASTPPETPPLRPTSRGGSPAPSITSLDSSMVNNASTLSPAGAGSSPRPPGEPESIMTSGGKAQLDPLWFGPFLNSEDVDEYFGIHFKHKSGLNLSFFAPITETSSQRLMDEPDQFLKELEDYLSSLVYDPPFLDPNETPSRSLLEEVSRQMAKEAVIARSLGGALPGDKEIRFLFFNNMNLAVKAQLGSTTGKGGLSIGSDVALSLLDIKQDFDRMPDATEISAKSLLNYWIVGKRLEGREIYMVVSRKDSTLAQVEDEVRKLASLYFNSNNGNSNTLSPSPSTVTTATSSAVASATASPLVQ